MLIKLTTSWCLGDYVGKGCYEKSKFHSCIQYMCCLYVIFCFVITQFNRAGSKLCFLFVVSLIVIVPFIMQLLKHSHVDFFLSFFTRFVLHLHNIIWFLQETWIESCLTSLGVGINAEFLLFSHLILVNCRTTLVHAELMKAICIYFILGYNWAKLWGGSFILTILVSSALHALQFLSIDFYNFSPLLLLFH